MHLWVYERLVSPLMSSPLEAGPCTGCMLVFPMLPIQAKRHRSEIPVFICEYHNEVPLKFRWKKIRRMKISQLKLRKHKIPCDGTYWTMQKAVWFLEILLCMERDFAHDRPFDVFTSASDGTRLMGNHAKPWQKRLFGRNSFVPSPGLQSFTFEVWWIFRGIHQ